MFKSFKSRIIILLFLANLPAALVAVAAGVSSYGDARALQQLAVQQAAEILASRAGEVLGVARAVISTLAPNTALVQDSESCRIRLEATIASTMHHTGAFLSREDGQLVCSAGRVPEQAENRASLFNVVAGRGPGHAAVFLAESMNAPNPRVVAARTVPLADGTAGILALTIEGRVFDRLFDDVLPLPRDGAILTGTGHGLASDPATESADWRPALAAVQPRVTTGFTARGADDVLRFYVMAPIPGTSAFVMMARPDSVIGAQDTRQLLATLGVPLAMIAFSIIAVLLGFNRFVLRWVRRLRVNAFDYAAGHYDSRIEGLESAPREIADLGDAFNTMAREVTDRSNALERALLDKDRILRELHHRVKNNFQMIASLLALQRRELPAEVRPLLRVPEDRVLAMAAAHKASYASGEIGHVQVLDLLSDVAVQIRQSFGARAPKIHVKAAPDVVETEVDLDRAVPMALLTSELVSAALAQTGDGTLVINITRLEDEEGLRLEISAPGISGTLPRTALPGRLVTAYIAQLHARLDSSQADVLSIIVPQPILPAPA